MYNGHDFLDTSSQQTLKSGNLDYPFPFSVSSRSVVSLSPSSVCPAVAVFSVLREGEGVLFYFACRPCDPDRFRLVAHSRILGCSHASFEWNALGDRALVTVGSDVDQVGLSSPSRADRSVLLRQDLSLLPLQRPRVTCTTHPMRAAHRRHSLSPPH